MPIRGKTDKQTKFSSNLTLYKAYTNHWTNLRRAETKKKNKCSLEAWEKETSNSISEKKKNHEKAGNYYTNEGTN